ncbi:hypothetical protein BMS3Bbin04_00240 [bacterium BMS3Bbin04]|nr:hypothetical protein BMS3Bbin04_00240 [bacterium BMS3Bbin04]
MTTDRVNLHRTHGNGCDPQIAPTASGSDNHSLFRFLNNTVEDHLITGGFTFLTSVESQLMQSQITPVCVNVQQDQIHSLRNSDQVAVHGQTGTTSNPDFACAIEYRHLTAFIDSKPVNVNLIKLQG